MTNYKTENDLEKFEGDIEVDAKDVTFNDTEGDLVSTNVHDALKELFTLSDSNRRLLIDAIGSPLNITSTYTNIISAILDSKTLLADTLIAKDVQAVNTMSFAEFADTILQIVGGGETTTGGVEVEMKTTDVISATASMTYKIGLTTYLKPSETVAQVYKYVAAQSNITHYLENFDNSNASQFNYDKEVIYFDGMAKIKDQYTYPLLNNGTYFETQEIDFGAFVDLDSIAMDEETNVFMMNGIKSNHALVTLKNDIPIDEALLITGIGMTNTAIGNGSVLVAVSRNKGLTYQVFNGAEFVNVDIDDEADFATNGMSASVLSAITSEQWQMWRNDASTIRFAYLLNRPSYSDSVGLDMVTMQAEMIARWIPAPTTDYEYTFSESAQEYTFTFKTATDYLIKYLDKASESDNNGDL